MSVFKNLFGGKSSATPDESQPKSGAESPQKAPNSLFFGRYSDINKDAHQLANWDKAMRAFEDKNYLDVYYYFLMYLRDEDVDNVKIERGADYVQFELIQGSQRITGKGDLKKFKASSNLAIMNAASIPVMRKLLTLNYTLSYSKFALRGITICMKFSSHAMDASPHKLYAGLSELAKKSDQQDDLLVSQFSGLEEVQGMPKIAMDPAVQAMKYDFLNAWIQEVRADIDRLDQEKMAAGISFLLLELTYKIDFFICPQGELMDLLERIQGVFFAKNDNSTAQRNTEIIKLFDGLLAWPKEKVLDGLYEVKSTFAIANPTAHKTVMDMMFSEREKVNWYRDNGHFQVVNAVYGYMISYAFFNYGMVYPVTRILNIGMFVMNPAFYKAMGDTNLYVNGDGSLNPTAISEMIQHIIADAQPEFPYLVFDLQSLQYSDPISFVDSLILSLDKIDLRKK